MYILMINETIKRSSFLLFSLGYFLKETENIFFVFLSSHRNTRKSLGELEKTCGNTRSLSISCSPKLPLACVSIAQQKHGKCFLFLKWFHKCIPSTLRYRRIERCMRYIRDRWAQLAWKKDTDFRLFTKVKPCWTVFNLPSKKLYAGFLGVPLTQWLSVTPPSFMIINCIKCQVSVVLDLNLRFSPSTLVSSLVKDQLKTAIIGNVLEWDTFSYFL